MKTALEKLNAAIADDVSGSRYFQSFSFVYDGFEFEYMGRFYAYVHPLGNPSARASDEYCWDDYSEMLSAQIDQTGKTVSEMLSELPDHDLEMSFDVSLPPGAEEKEP